MAYSHRLAIGAVDRLDKLHAKHILPGFKDRSAEEREIEALANEITRVSHSLGPNEDCVLTHSRVLAGFSVNTEAYTSSCRDVPDHSENSR